MTPKPEPICRKCGHWLTSHLVSFGVPTVDLPPELQEAEFDFATTGFICPMVIDQRNER